MTKHGLSTAVDKALDAAGAIKRYVMTSGKLQIKKPSGGSYWLTFQEAGTPDRVAFIPRTYVAGVTSITAIAPVYVEIKDEGDKLRDTQVDRMLELVALGFEVYVCSAKPDISLEAQRVVAAGVRWCVGAEALHQALVSGDDDSLL
jgi:hypothetical protein